MSFNQSRTGALYAPGWFLAEEECSRHTRNIAYNHAQVATAANGGKYDRICPEYQVTNTSWRVLKLILGTAKLANRWQGIELKK